MLLFNRSSLFAALFILLAFNAYPQLSFSLKGSAAIPSGYTEDYSSVGYGSTLNISYIIVDPNLELSLTGGILNFGHKENLPDYKFSFYSAPVLFGARFYLNDFDVIPYIGFEAGIYISEYHLEIDDGFFGVYTAVKREMPYGIAPEIGFKMNLSPNLDLDVNAKYNKMFTEYVARAYVLIQTGFSYKL